MADACTADGRRMAREVYTCSVRNFRNSRLLWPRLPKPTKRQKNLWRAFLAQSFLAKMPSAIQTKGRATPNRLDLQLENYLGKWTAHPSTRQCFDTLIGNNHRFLWTGSCYREAEGRLDLSPEEIPQPIYAVEKYDGRTKSDARWPAIDRSSVNWMALKWNAVPVDMPNNLMDSGRREIWMADLIWNVRQDCENLQDTLMESTLIRCGSDGGADDGKGSFGWTIRGKDDKPILSGIGSSDGHAPSSYRSECTGILSSLCVWDCLHNDKLLSSNHRLDIYCDNKGAVSVITKIFEWKNFFIGRDASEADLLHCIQYLARKHHGRLSIHWVESHQDEKNNAKLSKEALLNIEADRLATKALHQADRRPIIRLRKPAGCDLIINEVSIT